MSRGPKFADPTKPRGFYATPIFKYMLAATITLGGIWYASSYCLYSLLIRKRTEEYASKYKFIEPSTDVVENMVLQKLVILKHLKKQEEEARNK